MTEMVLYLTFSLIRMNLVLFCFLGRYLCFIHVYLDYLNHCVQYFM